MLPRHPWGDLAPPSDAPGADLTILGIPYDGAVCFRAGAAEAPARLRAISHSSAAVSEDGYVVEPARFRVRDAGDVAPPRDAAGAADGSESAREAYFERVQAAAAREMSSSFLFSIGGDHSVTIPLARAFASAHPRFGMVLLDAHPDLFDTYDGSKTSHACPMRRALETGALEPRHLLILGTRSYHPTELAFMKEAGVRFVPARELVRMGMEAAVELARRQLEGLPAVYLTLDIDVADPACAPGTGAPVAGGLSSRQLLDLTRGLLESLPVRAMDVVEIAPPLDPTDATLFLGLQIAFETFAVVARSRPAPATRGSRSG
ncbi:MAG TPA: arginase family protein [Vicinamibacteria bacterium]